MGCTQSTEGVIHSSEPGAPTPQFTAGNVITVPVIPGWDGIPLPTQNVIVEVMLEARWSGTSASFQPLTQVVINQAQAGNKLAGVFLPVFTQGKQKGQPIDGEVAGFRSFRGRAMLVFQADRFYRNVAHDVMFLQAPMQLTNTWGGESVSGFEGLYGQLQHAGTQGYPLSCILDEPNARISGWRSQESNVHLVCQKPNSQEQIPVSQYQIVSCPIESRAHFGSQSASMSNLVPLLSNYLTQGFRISSVYNPPNISLTGWTTTETQCHIILEKTAINYYFAVVDVPFTVSIGWGSRSVDHNQYLNVISGFANNGWELSAIIDMPDMRHEGFTKFSSTIKLIFQAPAFGGGPGGALA